MEELFAEEFALVGKTTIPMHPEVDVGLGGTAEENTRTSAHVVCKNLLYTQPLVNFSDWSTSTWHHICVPVPWKSDDDLLLEKR